MSLFRQLWLALMLTTGLAVIGSLLASTLSARSYLNEQLQQKNADNATALAMNLSHAGVDPIEMELTVAAMFDTGHYEMIRITSPTGEILVERVAPSMGETAPQWFKKLLPITAPAGQALINDGWRQVGKVSLASHSRFAYASLWNSTLLLIFTLTLAGVLGGTLGTLILRRLKGPLDSVTQQAKAITERRFITAPEPSVPELRQLSAAMNFAVTRLKSMFEEEAARLESVRQEANHDAVTGLTNRRHFMAGLSSLLSNSEAPSGTFIIIRLTKLSEINQSLGHHRTDEMLRTVGQFLQRRTASNVDAVAARLNGPDFALLLPGEALLFADAQQLLKDVEAQVHAYNPEMRIYLGFGEYRQGMELSQVLAQVDNALAKAELFPYSAVCASETTVEIARGEAQWAVSLRRALNQGWTRLASFPVTDFSGNVLHRECPLRLRLTENGEWHAAGEFLPMAERLDATADIDITAAKLALEKLKQDSTLPGIAINLSGRSLTKRGFKLNLMALLDEYSAYASRLWLEIPEARALSHLSEFTDFCVDIKLKGCRIGLEHCGNQSGQLGRFHGLPLDYLKVDASFIRDIHLDEGNQAFLKGLSTMANGIGLLVIAEGVTSQDELKILAELGLDGATGPAVQD